MKFYTKFSSAHAHATYLNATTWRRSRVQARARLTKWGWTIVLC